RSPRRELHGRKIAIGPAYDAPATAVVEDRIAHRHDAAVGREVQSVVSKADEPAALEQPVEGLQVTACGGLIGCGGEKQWTRDRTTCARRSHTGTRLKQLRSRDESRPLPGASDVAEPGADRRRDDDSRVRVMDALAACGRIARSAQNRLAAVVRSR